LISKVSMSSIAETGAAEQTLGGVDRAGEHEDGVDADEARVDDAGTGLEAERGGLLLGHQQHGAEAPSEICDELPAVCTPFSRATGFSVASFSIVVSRRPSSRLTVWVPSARLAVLVAVGRLDGDVLAGEAVLGPRLRGALLAAKPNASVSSRVMPHLSAMRSAPSNCEVISYCSK
jgi:hypothetical protein